MAPLRSAVAVAGLGAAVVLVRRRRRADRAAAAPVVAHEPPPWLRSGHDDPDDDLFVVLRADHDRLRRMAEDLRSRDPGSALAGRVAARRAAQELVMAASAHEALEELHFWPTVRSSLGDGDALAGEGLRQERAVRELLHHLDQRHADDPGFAALLDDYVSATADHVTFEEMRVWPGLAEALDAPTRRRIGRRLLDDRDRVPTRAHTSVPALPGRHRRLGGAIARLDRVADRVSQRGR